MANSIIRRGTVLLTFCRRRHACIHIGLSEVFSDHIQLYESSNVYRIPSRYMSTSGVMRQKKENDTSENRSSFQKRERPVVTNTMDEEEIETFRALAQTWWNETGGEFEALHAMNKLRIPFIRDGLEAQREDISEDPSLPLQGLKIVDAGCGGGLLAEPLARLGALVVGVDPVEQSIKVAQLHLEEDPAITPRVKYITGTIEDLVVTEAETFDAVVASEVVEHVSDLLTFVETCCRLIKPGGSVFFTTINKTQLSKGLAVFAAEKVFRVVPEGAHDWEKFVPPDDLQTILERNGVDTRKIHGMLFNPATREWSWMEETSINYALHGVKHDSADTDWSQTASHDSSEQTETTETQSQVKQE